MGSRQNAANAGAVHHREAGAVDGRGRRRSRRDRAAVLARRPQRLWNRSGETIPRSLRGHGPHPAGEAGIGGAAAEMEGATRDAGRAVTFLGPAAAWLTDGTADWFWPAAEKAGLPVMFLSPGQAGGVACLY